LLRKKQLKEKLRKKEDKFLLFISIFFIDKFYNYSKVTKLTCLTRTTPVTFINNKPLNHWMARLPKETKETLINKINNGTSINKISKKLNLAKSTIYHHYKKIKGKKYKEPIFISNLSKDEGEILGIIIGDGSLFYYKKHGHYWIKIRFGLINKKYALYVKDKFEKFFNKNFYLYEDCKNKLSLVTLSKKTYIYFNNFLYFKKGKKYCTVSINNLENLPKNFKLGLLKGLIDTDGCISKHSDGRIRISFHTTSKKLSEQFITLSEEQNFRYGIFSIKPNIKNIKGKNYKTREYYSIYLWKESTIPFIKLIKPFKSARVGL